MVVITTVESQPGAHVNMWHEAQIDYDSNRCT